jgi:DNA-binding response OmpR family regulator
MLSIEHIADVRMTNEPYRPSEPVSLCGKTILVADDEVSIRDLLQDILEPCGAHIYMARSGTEAWSIIEAQQPDMAILDIQMPAPDGLALVQQLRAVQNPMPVIIITAHHVANLGDKVLQVGANDYLPKPFDPDQIVAAVMRMLHCSRA